MLRLSAHFGVLVGRVMSSLLRTQCVPSVLSLLVRRCWGRRARTAAACDELRLILARLITWPGWHRVAVPGNHRFRWRRADQIRPMHETVKIAGLNQVTTINSLRYSCMAVAFVAAAEVEIIVDHCDTLMEMIEAVSSKPEIVVPGAGRPAYEGR
jgi:hypothetical protein